MPTEAALNKRCTELVKKNPEAAEAMLDWLDFTYDDWQEEFIADIEDGNYDDLLDGVVDAIKARYDVLGKSTDTLAIGETKNGFIIGEMYQIKTPGVYNHFSNAVVRIREVMRTRAKADVVRVGDSYGRGNKRLTVDQIIIVSIDNLTHLPDYKAPDKCAGYLNDDGSTYDCLSEASTNENVCSNCSYVIRTAIARAERARAVVEREQEAQKESDDEAAALASRRAARVKNRSAVPGKRRVMRRG